jgi:F-type H+-transporting ATPase subunit a
LGHNDGDGEAFYNADKLASRKLFMHPIEQFEIITLFPIVKIGNAEIALTNSALYMLIAVAIIALLMISFTSRKTLVPGRFQAIAEMTYEFVATNLQRTAGTEGMKFFPFVFSLFMFILVLNVISIIPYTFAVMAQIIITAALALLVFLIVIIYGFWKHGLRFLRVFVPTGIPIYILPLVSFIELLSFLSRPLSHSVRLFANMLAGHITLYVFGGFVTMVGAFGVLGWLGAIVPFAMTMAIMALELLVAFLQAYVFAILTCIYLNDAIHPGH